MSSITSTRALVPLPIKYDKIVALVCGVNKYINYSNLTLAAADAIAVANLLESSKSVEVTHLSDVQVKRATLRKELQKLLSTPASICIFYFAGHGIQTPG
ncbi:MAG: caspase family protein [Cyanobacteria bacterium P01_G01_bin.39]